MKLGCRLVILSFLIVLVGCQGNSACLSWHAQYSSQDNDLLRDESLITGEPCKAPCWQGLLPGISTKTDAVKVLEELPYIDSTKVEQMTWDDGSMLMSWEFAESSKVNPAVQISFDENEVISSMTVRPAYEVTVQDLINVYDLPDGLLWYTVGIPEAPSCLAGAILWFELGLEADTIDVENASLTRVNQPILQLVYFSPVTTINDYYSVLQIDRESVHYQEWPN